MPDPSPFHDLDRPADPGELPRAKPARRRVATGLRRQLDLHRETLTTTAAICVLGAVAVGLYYTLSGGLIPVPPLTGDPAAVRQKVLGASTDQVRAWYGSPERYWIQPDGQLVWLYRVPHTNPSNPLQTGRVYSLYFWGDRCQMVVV